VYNEAARARVTQTLMARGLDGSVPVRIRPDWYYQ